MESRPFPWRRALAAAGLLGLALLTVSIRAQAVAEGRSLLAAELRCASLHRHERDLRLKIQKRWHELGRLDLATPRNP